MKRVALRGHRGGEAHVGRRRANEEGGATALLADRNADGVAMSAGGIARVRGGEKRVLGENGGWQRPVLLALRNVGA